MAATLALGAAGCGSVTATQAQEDNGADSWRFDLHTSTAPDDLMELYFSGAYDLKRHVGRVEITDHEDSSAYTKCEVEDRLYPEEVRVTRDNEYSRWLTWGESFWVKGSWSTWPHPDVIRAIAPFPLGDVDPTDVLERLRSLGAELVVVGHRDVGHVPTTQYRAQLDIWALLQRIPVTEQPRQAVLDFWRRHPDPGHVDVWVDDTERVRRMELRLNVEESGYVGDGMTYSLELFDFGVLVDVEQPKRLATIEDYYRATEELYPKDDRCESPEYRLRPEEPDPLEEQE